MANDNKAVQVTFRYKYNGLVLDEVKYTVNNRQLVVFNLVQYFRASYITLELVGNVKVTLDKTSEFDYAFRPGQIVYLTGDRFGQELEWLALGAKEVVVRVFEYGRKAFGNREKVA